jgi:hypothetical protein
MGHDYMKRFIKVYTTTNSNLTRLNFALTAIQNLKLKNALNIMVKTLEAFLNVFYWMNLLNFEKLFLLLKLCFNVDHSKKS